MKTILILQSNYIPWKGYFDMINIADEFVIYDTAQYTKNDWRNRNYIKTNNGKKWLSIPISQKTLNQTIQQTYTADKKWKKKHWETIEQFYKEAAFWEKYSEIFKTLYINNDETNLSKINHSFISKICEILSIKTKLSWSSDYNLIGGKSEKLVSICKQANANIYLSGPSAKDYIDEDLFANNNIKVEWMSYSGYKEYNQLFPPFEGTVSILDLIFNEGPNAHKYMKSFKLN